MAALQLRSDSYDCDYARLQTPNLITSTMRILKKKNVGETKALEAQGKVDELSRHIQWASTELTG